MSPAGAFAAAAQRCSEQSAGTYRVELVALPADADQQREQLVRRLAARDSDIDIIGMDVIWIPEFAAAGWILPGDNSSVTVGEDGSYLVTGKATYVDAHGQEQTTEGLVFALCRCGGSENKPFCDGSHTKLDITPAAKRPWWKFWG